VLDTNARRESLLKVMSKRRHDRVSNLAFEFNVNERTIRRDIQKLSEIYPIYAERGRYGGGVFIENGACLGKKNLSNKQVDFLKRQLQQNLSEFDKEIALSIIKDFTKSK